jgi:protein-tyrosine phosphatase
MTNIVVNMFDNANKILKKTEKNGDLWLGNYNASLDVDFLSKNNISVIINATPDIPYIYEISDLKEINKIKNLETFRIPVFDSLMEHDILLMEQYYHKVIPFILHKLITEKRNVLVNCYAGRQRSASVVAAVLYVILDNNIIDIPNLNKSENKSDNMKNIIKFILKKRPVAFSFGLRVNFKHSLEKFFKIKF